MSESLIFRFSIDPQMSEPSEANIRAAVDAALAEAIAEAKAEYDVGAESDVEGGFGGAGETIVVITIWHLLKAAGVAFAKGAVGAAGKAFVEKYLLPKLRARDVVPGDPKEIAPPDPATGTEEADGVGNEAGDKKEEDEKK
jgi:hypothetical protein